MSLFGWFDRKDSLPEAEPLLVDVHSHLLPAIDDGARDLNDSLAMIMKFKELGYNKLITTPHILQDYYPNTPVIIREKLAEVKQALSNNDAEVEIEAAAEYYLDEFLLEKIKAGEELLTFGTKYLLFEMGFFSESPFIKEFIFMMRSAGITPILAHAERYSYYSGKMDTIEDLVERGCLIQININSFAGHYGKPVQQSAEKLVDSGMVHLLGSDCHTMEHLEVLISARKSKYFRKALHLQLINRTL